MVRRTKGIDTRGLQEDLEIRKNLGYTDIPLPAPSGEKAGRGRPKGAKRTEKILLALSPEEKEEIAREAEKTGEAVSVFIRRCALGECRRS